MGGLPSSNPFHQGNSLSSTQANFDGNYPYGGTDQGPYLERTCSVGSYPANAFGLFDMHGNVYEWCLDGLRSYSSGDIRDPLGPQSENDARVLRGGSGNIFVNGFGGVHSTLSDQIQPGLFPNQVQFNRD